MVAQQQVVRQKLLQDIKVYLPLEQLKQYQQKDDMQFSPGGWLELGDSWGKRWMS